jgi:hypothetical protein
MSSATEEKLAYPTNGKGKPNFLNHIIYHKDEPQKEC